MLILNPVVLYAEDEEGDRFFMQHAFKRAGLASVLRTVPDGDAAIHYLSGIGPYADRSRYPFPHLVLLDLNMPRISGFEVLQWVRQNPACGALPVIIFTASSRGEDRARALALGASDYWEKPNSGLRYTQVATSLREKWLSIPESSPAPFAPQPHL